MQRHILLAGIITTLTVTALSASLADVVTIPGIKCQAAKLKAFGKLQACLQKEHADVLFGKTDDSAKCQTKFQTALAKADAKAGTPCPYMDNADGTVTDLKTGLMWEQKTGMIGTGIDCTDTTCSNPHEVNNLYRWSAAIATAGPPDGGAFTDFLGKLNKGTSSDGNDTPTACFAGHCDWRLPTVQELKTLRLQPYPCGTNPCIDPALGPTQSNRYYSSTTSSSTATEAWYVDFFAGGLLTNGKALTNYVRAVRGGL